MNNEWCEKLNTRTYLNFPINMVELSKICKFHSLESAERTALEFFSPLVCNPANLIEKVDQIHSRKFTLSFAPVWLDLEPLGTIISLSKVGGIGRPSFGDFLRINHFKLKFLEVQLICLCLVGKTEHPFG